MIHHASTEELSAYLDSDLGFAESGQLEAHCATCAECGARLASLRRVVSGLGRVERVEPPAALRQQIRRQVQTAPPQGLATAIRSALDGFRLLFFPISPVLRTSAATGLAMVVGLFAFSLYRVGGVPLPSSHQENVSVTEGVPSPSSLLETTSEVAGFKFVWTDTGWVQRGLEWKTPEALVDARSPEGRALLTRYSGLEMLMRDGSSVVFSYDKETVELRRTPPVTRVLDYPAGLLRGQALTT